MTMLAGGDFRLEPLRPQADEPAVTDLFRRCADYVVMVMGEAPDADSGRAFFAAAPDGKTSDDMLKLGVFDPGGALVALAEIARDHPGAGTWYIGLVLVDPASRNRGIGAAVVAAIKHQAAALGASRLLLSVIKENARALKFWRAHGFAVTRELPTKRFGRTEHARFELAFDISSAD